MGDSRRQFDAGNVTFLPSNSPRTNSLRIDPNSHPNPALHSGVDFTSAPQVSLNAYMSTARNEEEEEEEEEGRTMSYLDKIGKRVWDERTRKEKIWDSVKEGCGKVSGIWLCLSV